MWNRVEQFIKKYKLLDTNELYLVALSGGADSVALLILLDEMGYNVHAVHCNFHLRGDESDRDEQFCQSLCSARNVPFHRVHFDTLAYAELHHLSVETAARSLRYRYFEQLRADLGAAGICVAHHRDDQVETVLMNIIRGTGVRGLTGIRPRNGYLLRPLLCVSRADIEAFLCQRGQQYVTDSTNMDDDATRNKVRHHLVPLLKELNAQAADNIVHLSERMTVVEQLLQERIAALKGRTELTATEVMAACPGDYVLYEVLRDYGFNAAQCRQIYDVLQAGATGRLFSAADYDLLVDRSRMLIERRSEPLPPVRIPEEGVYALADSRRLRVRRCEPAISYRPDTATVDAGKVAFPLTLRRVQTSDRMQPYGMQGSKLLSDMLTDAKLSLLDKRRQLVVVDANGVVVWLVGMRVDQRVAVDDTTREVIELALLR